MSTLNDALFAYPEMRKYPLHTKEAALKSFKEFDADTTIAEGALRSDILKRIEKAAAYYEIDLDALKQEGNTSVDNGEEKRETPHGVIFAKSIKDIDSLNSEVAELVGNRKEYSGTTLRPFASYIISCADDLGADLSGDDIKKVMQLAGIGVGDRESCKKALLDRADLLELGDKSREALKCYIVDIDGLEDKDFLDHDTLLKIVDMLEDIDENYGFRSYYGDKLSTPESSVFVTGIDDVLEEASDHLEMPSIEAIISKKALKDRREQVNGFLTSTFADYMAGDDEKMFAKVASLDYKLAQAFLARFV